MAHLERKWHPAVLGPGPWALGSGPMGASGRGHRAVGGASGPFKLPQLLCGYSDDRQRKSQRIPPLEFIVEQYHIETLVSVRPLMMEYCSCLVSPLSLRFALVAFGSLAHSKSHDLARS